MLRDHIVERTPMPDNDGASGATLEHARLDDGTTLVLKTFDPERDLTMSIPGRTVPMDVELWRTGTLDRLPPASGHAVRDAWQEEGRWVVAMIDVGARLLSYETRFSRDQCRRLLAAAVSLHDVFRGEAPPILMAAEQRLCLFAPSVMARYAGGENPLPAWCLAGWEAFDTLAPADVRDLVRRIQAEPALLTGPLRRRGGETLLHGDFWTPNLAPGPDRVIVIDWALATLGPPVLEFTSFLVGCAGQVEATLEQILDDLRGLWGDAHDDVLLQAGLVFGVVEMGWNLGWYLAHDPSPAAQATFDWWVQAARAGVATGLLG